MRTPLATPPVPSTSPLTRRGYWAAIHSRMTLPQSFRPSSYPDHHALFSAYLPAGQEFALLEVGCAPGRWLAYFAKHHGCRVSGIDYDGTGCELTRENLRLLEVPATIEQVDLFGFSPRNPFDIVFSNGFIEHFDDPFRVVKTIASLVHPDSGFVVTLVPNTYGLNGFISRTFRPDVYRAHQRITVDLLASCHEQAGLRLLFAGHVGGVALIAPFANNDFARRRPRLCRALNMPVTLGNRMVRALESALGWFPRSRLLSTALIVIATRSRL